MLNSEPEASDSVRSETRADNRVPARRETPLKAAEADGPVIDLQEDRRKVIDLVLALAICIGAVAFWFWSGRTNNTALSNPVSSIAAPSPASATADALVNEGTRYYKSGNYPAAEAAFRRAIAANPQSALAFCDLGAVLIPQKRYQEAIAVLKHALALDPSLTLAQNNLKWAEDEKAKQR